jgi:hypothetical protein
MRIASIVVVVWLLIGLIAAGQRGYLHRAEDATCARASTIAVTIVAGPLNYVGVNPKVRCELPEPSS